MRIASQLSTLPWACLSAFQLCFNLLYLLTVIGTVWAQTILMCSLIALLFTSTHTRSSKGRVKQEPQLFSVIKVTWSLWRQTSKSSMCGMTLCMSLYSLNAALWLKQQRSSIKCSNNLRAQCHADWSVNLPSTDRCPQSGTIHTCPKPTQAKQTLTDTHKKQNACQLCQLTVFLLPLLSDQVCLTEGTAFHLPLIPEEGLVYEWVGDK